MASITTSDVAIVIAATIDPPRFRGRAYCVRSAATDETAVAALLATPRERMILALRGDLSPDVLAAVRTADIDAAEQVRADRRRSQARDRDPLADRQPGKARFRAAYAKLKTALTTAEFRGCRNGHETKIVSVARGSEYARSATFEFSSRSVGMSAAYCRRQWHVTVSEHEIGWSTAILGAPVSVPGCLYLTRDLRVRQGRGSSLVMERRRGPRGGWVTC
jgi:hypothetical protein